MDAVTAQRTYWHLLGLERKPTDYDIATSRLLYYPERGFEVNVRVAPWYARHQRRSPLTCRDWDAFRDPRETTYTRYVDRQRAAETYVDGLLASIETSDYDRKLPADWIPILARLIGPARYAGHGLQMVAAYVGSMAPSGRIVIAAGLQCADEIRRIQRLAYRIRQLQDTHAGFAADSRAVWERDALWQPLRELVERLLVTYDWGEALVALNLVTKPVVDDLLGPRLAALAARHDDDCLARIAMALHQDAVWHAEWTRALCALVVADDAANQAVIDEWRARWTPRAEAVTAAFAPIVGTA